MLKQKRWGIIILFVAMICCLSLSMPGLYFTAQASTNTDGMWQNNGQTQNLIPTLHEGDVRDQGWNIDEPNAQANAAERDGGWAILASDGGPDLGNSDFTGGVYYVIELSAADQAKARAGQLSISASTRAWIQGWWASHHLSIRAEFFNTSDISGTGFHTESATFAPGTNAADRIETIAMEQRTIPSGTVKIKMWFSNQGSLDGRPWLGSMACYLHDTTAPSFTRATLDDSGVIDPDSNIAIAGNTVKYRVQFNEKVSVSASGTATLTLGGQQLTTSSSTETIDADGTTSVIYTFVLLESNTSGTLALSSVSGLRVTDEAGNEFTYSGSPSAETLTFYGTMAVSSELQKLTLDGELSAKYGTDYTAALVAEQGYSLPTSVRVTVGGVAPPPGGFTYDARTGQIRIYGRYITGDIVIAANGVPKQYTILFDRGSGSGGTSSAPVTYDAALPAITAPSRTGYTFGGYYTERNGGGDRYYDESGAGVLSAYTVDDDLTLYANWTANAYTVIYDKNRPSTVSEEVDGTIGNSDCRYDTEFNLPSGGYTLTGWTFMGWTTASGGYIYDAGESVSNLTAEANGRVTLYAVWEANEYTVIYNPNKPTGASSPVQNETASSSHTYDTASPLSANEFELTGWTFMGWATESGDGASAVYTDGQNVSTLVSQDGSEITLYAVWKANDYTITLNAAGGSNSGSVGAIFDSVLNDIPAIPARYGYNFRGYFDAETGGEQYYGADGKAFANKTFTTDGNILLYAQWSPITYTIELYSEGNYIDRMEEVVFGALELPSAQALDLARSNFDFVGWNMYDEQNWAMYRAETPYTIGLTGEQGGVVVLYAAWSEKPVYTIGYDANGGAGAPAMAQAHEYETIYLDAAVPTRADHTFLGWATSAAAPEPEFSAGGEFTMGSSVVTLYAVWKHNPALSYDANGGEFSGTIEPSYPASGSAVTIITVKPVREGYVFLGWAADREAEEAQYPGGGEFYMPDADTVLYAVWQREQYSVTLQKGSFEVSGLAGNYYYGEVAEFTVTGGTGEINIYINGERAMPQGETYTVEVTGDLTIVVTDGSELSLIYSANGGTGAPVDPVTYQPEATAVISDEEPVREGYTFLGWATDESAAEADYLAGENVQFAADDIVLYAVWTANNYSVEYRGNSGTGEMESSAFVYDRAGNLSKNVFEKEGFTFVGWSLSENGDAVYGDMVEVINLTAADGGSVLLYAVWESTVTEIVFDADGGSGGSGQTSVAYGEELSSGGLEIPRRAGYTFGGYYTEKDGAGEMVFDGTMNIAEAYGGAWELNETRLTLYARWVPVSYFVVYMNGQTRLAEQAVLYGVSFDLRTAADLELAAEEGHHFAGWATMPNSAGIAYSDGQSIEVGLSQTEGAFVYLYAVFAEKDRTERIYMIINIVLGSAAAILAAMLIIRMVKNRKKDE